jgi:hypothetical protein
MPGDCAGPLKKEKRMVISAPSARGMGNCVTLICRLFRPSSELVVGPSTGRPHRLYICENLCHYMSLVS